jgi:hypothetical protein
VLGIRCGFSYGARDFPYRFANKERIEDRNWRCDDTESRASDRGAAGAVSGLAAGHSVREKIEGKVNDVVVMDFLAAETIGKLEPHLVKKVDFL